MKEKWTCLKWGWVILLVLVSGCGQREKLENTELKNRESIHDRKVFIEPKLITEIPEVSRWCDRLPLKKHKINVGDAELYVEEEGEGPALVLINGGPGGTHHYFHPWFSRLKKDVRVIYYDQRGCGLSDFKPGENGYTVQQAVADLEEIRKKLSIKKWTVLGYSYGGFLAQYYTVNYPQSVSGLILMGASPGMWTDTGKSNQNMFISEEEISRMKEIRQQLKELDKTENFGRKRYIQILLYNNHLNGDWKRQNYYKPNREELAQAALYEWVQDKNFNGIMNDSAGRVNLEGLFKNNPIPTLILEGEWDLTWGPRKAIILKRNHPNAEILLFEKAGHAIYNERPEKFFKTIGTFMKNLKPISTEDITSYKNQVHASIEKIKASPRYYIRGLGWGPKSSKVLSDKYSPEWMQIFTTALAYLKIGFALYDCKKLPAALEVFRQAEALANKEKNERFEIMAQIWQGHMLDLIGKRNQAILVYKKIAGMNISGNYTNEQYQLTYNPCKYAESRIKDPFKRIENTLSD